MPALRRPRRLSIDPEKVVVSVQRRLERLLNDRERSEWLQARLDRYAKFRGWLSEKTYPYEGAANADLPIMMSQLLRQDAGLYNATMTTRPLLSAKPLQSRNAERGERATEVVDAQIFLETPDAKRRLGDFITNFLVDSNVVAYTPWVKDRRTVRRVWFLPPLPAQVDEGEYLLSQVTALFPTALVGPSPSGLQFVVRTEREELVVNVYDAEEGGYEVVAEYEATVFDGPIFHVLNIEDVVVPVRAGNLQPPSPANPRGAPYIFILLEWTLDEVLHQKNQGILKWLTDEGLEQLRTAALGGGIIQEQGLKEQKAEIEGQETTSSTPEDQPEEQGHLPIRLVMAFDRWPVGTGGEHEDVFFLVGRDAPVLLDAKRLTDLWPSAVPYRPLAEAVFIPVPDRYYGISLLELTEHTYDLIVSMLNLSIDSGKFSNIPPFFYSASAAWRGETIRYAPGEGYPVPGDPRASIYFPTVSGRDQSWALNMVSLAFQFLERVTQIGDVQLGRVPTGRASALRTAGATMALLQQGDVRADQILLRLLNGFAQVAQNFHRLNRHFLPPEKEYRIWGYEPSHREAYRTLKHRDEIDADMDFEFQASFLLSNPSVLAQSLQSLMAVVVSPLMIQLGITDPEKIYQLVKDYVKSLRLDHARYVGPPSGFTGPRWLWEEALSMILENEPVEGRPLEPAEEHLAKAQAFVGSEQFGLLNTQQAALLRAWLNQVAQQAMTERSAQAAAQFQNVLAQRGAEVPETATGEAPEVGSGVAVPEQAVGNVGEPNA